METTVEVEVLDMDVELQVYDKVAAAVEEAKAKCANIVLKYDTPQDIKESKSFIYQLRQLKAPIAEIHSQATAEARKFKRALDAKKNLLIGAVEQMIEEKYAPIKKIEEAAAAKKAEEERIAREKAEAEEAARQAKLEAREKAVREAEEKVRAEKEEIARKERERQIAETAKKEEAARREKFSANLLAQAAERREAAEVKAAQAAVDAENRRLADIQREKDKAAEKERLVMEEQRADRAAQLELESQEQERIADQDHRKAIHKDIYATLIHTVGLHPNDAKVVGVALRDGRIPHTQINY